MPTVSSFQHSFVVAHDLIPELSFIMLASHEYKIWPLCSHEHIYDDLIVFNNPSLMSPIFPIEAKMSQMLFEGNAHIVPMPSWSTYTGAIRFLVAFITLVLTAAAGAFGAISQLSASPCSLSACTNPWLRRGTDCQIVCCNSLDRRLPSPCPAIQASSLQLLGRP